MFFKRKSQTSQGSQGAEVTAAKPPPVVETLPSGALARLTRPAYQPELDQYPLQDLVAALLKRLDDPNENFAPLKHWPSILAIELERRSGDRAIDRFSRERLKGNMQFLFRHDFLRPNEITGKTVVELGCGGLNPLARLMVFVMLGAERALGFDLDVIQDSRLAAIALSDTIRWMLLDPASLVGNDHPSRHAMIDALQNISLEQLQQGDWSSLAGSPLEFRQESMYDIDLDDNSVDVMFSMSFLEHIPDCRKALEKCYQMTKPGGIQIHAIDGFDHGSYGPRNLHPLEFLKEETTEPIVRGCNRVRPLEFVTLFEEAGFEILWQSHHGMIDLQTIQRQDLAMRFRSMSDEMLAVGRIHLAVRKN